MRILMFFITCVNSLETFFTQKPDPMGREDIIKLIEDFLSDPTHYQTGWDLDRFIGVNRRGANVKKIRRELKTLRKRFPPLHADAWCSDEGINTLKTIVERLPGEDW